MLTAYLLLQGALLVSFQAGSAQGWMARTAVVPNRIQFVQRAATSTAFWQDESTILQNIDADFAERQWYLPSIVERALIHGDISVDPHQLLQALDMSTTTRNHAIEALEASDANVMNAPAILTREECHILQDYLLANVEQELGRDNVDQCADWQVNITEDDLAALIGQAAMDRLYQVPSLLDNESRQSTTDTTTSFERVGIFVRVYERSLHGRPWMPFHSDGNSFTVNVALNDDTDYQGGTLLALTGGKLCAIHRQQGDATCHKGSVYHAVSAMTSGRRYSMILFFHEK